MRNTFIERLTDAAETDSRIFLLCGDLGYSVLEAFAERHPDRFVNVGVAEQNMVGIAAGLALSGYKVFTYSIVNFAVTRCLEQIRNDVCYHELDVTVVAVGGGFAYGAQGYSHHGSEDVGFTRMLPGMHVAVPADAAEAAAAADYMLARKGPGYVRLARGREPQLHRAEIDELASFHRLDEREGAVLILASGPVAGEALTAANLLFEAGINASAVSTPIIKPFDVDAFCALLNGTSLVVTVEEHVTFGGLGSTVAETLADAGASVPLLRLGIDHKNRTIVGSQDYLRNINGINGHAIAARIWAKLEER